MTVYRRAFVAVAVLAAMTATGASAAWKPNKPVEFVVTAGPGGGTDNFARAIQSVITKNNLLDVAIVVTNKGGGAGSEGFVYGKGAEGDAHKLMFGTSNEWGLPLVAKLGYKYDDLTPVAALSVDEFLVWVKADSPYKNIKDFVAAAKAANGKLKFGGSQAKDVDQILVRHIERAADVKFTYIPFKSGGEVGTQLVGGHVEANVNNPNENIAQWRAANVRPLCVFAPDRMAIATKVTETMSWADIPTCKSEGLPVAEYRMPRTVFLPGGVPKDAVAFYVDLLAKVVASEDWKTFLDRNQQSAWFVSGTTFADYIRKDEARSRQQFKEDGWLVE